MNFSTRNKYILFFMLLSAFFLRVWGIGFGLPELFHQDEPIVVNHALTYGAGDLNPHFFAIPPLTSYLLFIVYGIMFLLGKAFGVWASSQDLAMQFFRDPTLFYLAGRIFIGLIPGVACVFVTILFARRFLNSKGALYAGAVMAFSFLNVVNSHYIYTDMLLVLAVLLTYNAIYSICRKSDLRSYISAGIFMGVAVGVKYNAGILVLPYILAHIFGSFDEGKGLGKIIFSPKLWAGAIAAFISFVLVNPFFLLDLSGFLNSFSKQSHAFWYIGWSHHITYSLFEGFSMALTIFGLLGLLVYACKDKWGVILLSFPAALYFVLVYKSQPFARYVLPLIPFFSIGAAYFLFNMFSWESPNRRVRQGIMVIAIAMLTPGIIKSVKADMLFTSGDTRVDAAVWVKDKLQVGTLLACDSTNFRPAIKQPYSQMVEKEFFLGSQQGLTEAKIKKIEMLKKISDKNSRGYPIYFLSESPGDQGQFLNTIPAITYDMDAINAAGIRYVSINSQISNKAKRDFLPGLISASDLVAEFSPYRDGSGRGTFDRTATTCLPVSGKEIHARVKTGPVLRIYRIK